MPRNDKKCSISPLDSRLISVTALYYLHVNMNLKILLRQKNDRLIRSNKEWIRYKEKTDEEWLKYKEEKRIVIEDFRKKNEELRKKYEDKSYDFEEFRAKYDAENIAALKKSNESKECEKLKNDFGILNNKYESALNEIDKLARWINIYGETFSLTDWIIDSLTLSVES